jgi:hypothetical protein
MGNLLRIEHLSEFLMGLGSMSPQGRAPDSDKMLRRAHPQI